MLKLSQSLFTDSLPCQIAVKSTISTDLKDLFWEVFFKSKNRGISLERHFPWLETDSDNTFFFEAKTLSITVGGLVLRLKKYRVNESEMKIGLIGLVCVEPTYRGNGIATELLKKTISYSKDMGYDCLTLWTNQHSIYIEHDFYVSDPWCYGSVETNACTQELDFSSNNLIYSITEILTASLPPFAYAMYKYTSGDLSFTLLKDDAGDIVVDFNGNTAELVLFMIQTLPKNWRLNCIKNDPLLSALMHNGANLKMSPVNIQMWRCLKTLDSKKILNDFIIIPLLDRI